MKMRTKLYIPILAGALMLTGCSKDFLEKEPAEFATKDQIDEASEDRPQIQAGTLAGLYSLMYTAGAGGTDLSHTDFGHKGTDVYSDMLSGDMVLAGYTYGWYQDIVEYQATTDYTYTNNRIPWTFYYRLIRGANTVIDGLGGNDATPEADEAKYNMGQAKAMRAFAYFYLVNLYGEGYNPSEPVLPIYTGLEEAQPLSTTQEVYDLVISDLTDAVSLLEGFNRTAKTQINQDVAKGLLAYAYAATGNYPEVQQLTQEVIDAGVYSLVDADQALGGFNDSTTSGWMWGIDLTLDYGLDLVSWWGQIDIFTYSYAWAGDPKVINSDLYDAIPDNDVRKSQFVDLGGTGDNGVLYPANKFYAPAREIGGQREVTTDYVYMRVAEMYLLNAEAAAKNGDEDAAKASLKALLNERLDDVSYVDALSGQALEDEIYLQTRIELWGEGKVYLAVERNKKTVTLPPNHKSLAGESYPYDADELSFEIPQREIQNNPNITQ